MKSKFFRAINKCLNTCFKNKPDQKVKRLPQSFITNIKINFNKNYLPKKLIEIYNEYNVIEETFIKDDGVFRGENKKILALEILHMNYGELITAYISSQQFIEDKISISEREGEKLCKLFNFTAENFRDYYSESKGNKSLKN